MAQNYGSNNIIISITDHGATPRIVTSYIRTINGLDVQAILVLGHTFGDTWEKSLYTNIRKAADVTFGGYYDDSATTSPNVLFSDFEGDTRAIIITWGNSHTSAFSGVLMSYKRLPVLNDLTKFESTFRPTGTVTEA